MIPYFDGRVGPGLEVLGSRTKDEDYSCILPSLKRPHLDYFRMFYADIAFPFMMAALVFSSISCSRRASIVLLIGPSGASVANRTCSLPKKSSPH
jgi:hypothetical protein